MSTTESLKGTLLIVDDMPANISVLFEFLSEEGFRVLVAQDGKRAIQKAEYVKPDLILLDVMMPGMDGFETCRILKSQQDTKNIPIIFMTALADTLDKVKGFSLGAADYITKPIQHEEVLARVNTQLRFCQLQKQLIEQNKELQEQKIELEQRNMELDAFARTVAHDLKNPLNIIVGYADILTEICVSPKLSDQNSQESLDSIKAIAQAANKMTNIIDALLLLAGVSRQQHVDTTSLDMNSLLVQVLNERLNKMLKEYNGRINLPNHLPQATGYQPWIEEVWVNYLSNGLKYGGRPPVMDVGADVQDDGMIRFWVHDNGPSLTVELQAQLFTPFTRLHKDRAEGHGLGLSIVRQVIEKLGGKVGIESEPGNGCLFYFTLPVKSQTH